MKGVGQSNRTIGKHILLNKVLGREVGAMIYTGNKFGHNSYTILDLCAGDGKKSYYSDTSSPMLINKHMGSLKEKSDTIIKIFMFEKDKGTFDVLNSKFDNCYNLDSLNITEVPGHPDKESRCFIHADPNTINDWPISNKLLTSSPKFTTMLITMGCNVGGLKRLPLSEREKWGSRLDSVIENIAYWHDALLIRIKGDKAQWSYFVVGPKVWHDKGIYKADAKKSFKYLKKEIECAQLKCEPEKFYAIRDTLFYTKKELIND